MSTVLSDFNHSLQQTLQELQNIVTAASAIIDEAQRIGDEEKVKAQFANAENGAQQAIDAFHQQLKASEEKLMKDPSSEGSVSARVKQIVRTFQDGLGALKKEVLDRYPDRKSAFVMQLSDVGKRLENFLDVVSKAYDQDVKSQKKLVQKTVKDIQSSK